MKPRAVSDRHLIREFRSKRELAQHLTTPHGTRAVHNDVPALMKWRRDELDQLHQEFHQAMG